MSKNPNTTQDANTITLQDKISTHMNADDLRIKKTVKTTKNVNGELITMEREFTFDLSNCTVEMLFDFVVQNRAIAHQGNLRKNEGLWLNTVNGHADTVDVSLSYRKPAMTDTQKTVKAFASLNAAAQAEVRAMLDAMTAAK